MNDLARPPEHPPGRSRCRSSDGTKIAWHLDRVAAWGTRRAHRADHHRQEADAGLHLCLRLCYATLQENDRKVIDKPVIDAFLEDCAEIGVKGISPFPTAKARSRRCSPTHHPRQRARAVDGHRHQRFPADAGRRRTDPAAPDLPAHQHLGRRAGALRRDHGRQGILTIACSTTSATWCASGAKARAHGHHRPAMVLMPQIGDQVLPLAKLGRELGVDYCIFKHCSDNEDGDLQGRLRRLPGPVRHPARSRGHVDRQLSGLGQVVEDHHW